VPIWKREHADSGATWVGGPASDEAISSRGLELD
jgi:molybdopterin synthase catalytic subunit